MEKPNIEICDGLTCGKEKNCQRIMEALQQEFGDRIEITSSPICHRLCGQGPNVFINPGPDQIHVSGVSAGNAAFKIEQFLFK